MASNNFPFYVYETREFFPSIEAFMARYGSCRIAIRNALHGRTNTWHGWHLVPYDMIERDRWSVYFKSTWSKDAWHEFIWDYQHNEHDNNFKDKWCIKTNEQMQIMYHMAREQKKFETAKKVWMEHYCRPDESYASIGRLFNLDYRTVARYINNYEIILFENNLMHGDVCI